MRGKKKEHTAAVPESSVAMLQLCDCGQQSRDRLLPPVSEQLQRSTVADCARRLCKIPTEHSLLLLWRPNLVGFSVERLL